MIVDLRPSADALAEGQSPRVLACRARQRWFSFAPRAMIALSGRRIKSLNCEGTAAEQPISFGPNVAVASARGVHTLIAEKFMFKLKQRRAEVYQLATQVLCIERRGLDASAGYRSERPDCRRAEQDNRRGKAS